MDNKKANIIGIIVALIWILSFVLWCTWLCHRPTSEGLPIAEIYTDEECGHYIIPAPSDVYIDRNAYGYDYEVYSDHIDLILHYERFE